MGKYILLKDRPSKKGSRMKKEFESLFPLTVEITQAIIKKSDIRSRSSCIGAYALKSGIGDKKSLLKLNRGLWMNRNGHVQLKDDTLIKLTTLEGIPLMYVTEPQTITFIIRKS